MIELLMRRRGMAKVLEVPFENQYLTFEALEGGTFQFSNAVNYSLDGGRTWVALEAATDTPTLSVGDKILWKATLTPNSTDGIGTFSSSGEYNAMGNPLSLRLGDSFKGVTTIPNNTYTFYKLFANSTGLISAKNLSLICTTIRQYCYNRMFLGCSNLVDVCDLPATALQAGAYAYMFYGCSSLEKAPYMSADYTIGTTTAAGACLGYMFYGCTSMTSIDKIPSNNTSTKYSYAYDHTFMNCSSLASIPSVTINLSKGYDARSMFTNCISLSDVSNITFSGATAAYKACENMFNGCTALVNAMTSLPATTTNGANAYYQMFYGCTALTKAPSISLTTLSESCMAGMFRGCTSLITPPPILPATTAAKTCYNQMFYGCTSLESAPELPMQTLGNSSYKEMFRGCTNLAYVKCLATSVSAADCVYNWMNGVTSAGTFIKHPDATWNSGVSGIPNNWTILEGVQITITYTGGNSGAYLKEIGGSDIIHTFVDGEAYEADLDDAKSYGVYDSGDNLVETLTTPFNRTNSITI